MGMPGATLLLQSNEPEQHLLITDGSEWPELMCSTGLIWVLVISCPSVPHQSSALISRAVMGQRGAITDTKRDTCAGRHVRRKVKQPKICFSKSEHTLISPVCFRHLITLKCEWSFKEKSNIICKIKYGLGLFC